MKRNKGQVVNGAMVGIAILTAIGYKVVDFAASRIWDSPDITAKEIVQVKTAIADTNVQVARVCTYATNQADRMDKNLQAIAKALKVDVVTGNDKDNPCTK